MASGLTILQALAPARTPRDVDQVCRLACIDPADAAARKLVLKTLGRLLTSGFVDRTEEKRAAVFGAPTPKSFYRLTKVGHEFLGSEATLTRSGKKNPLKGWHASTAKRETLRARAWRALRMMGGKGSVPDIVELARRKSDDPKKAHANIQKFFWQLQAAGIVKPLERRQPNHTAGVIGFYRYALINDLGPKPPLAGRKFVFDPNKKERHAYADTVRRAA